MQVVASLLSDAVYLDDAGLKKKKVLKCSVSPNPSHTDNQVRVQVSVMLCQQIRAEIL